MTAKAWIELEDCIMRSPDAEGHFARLLVAGGWLWLELMHRDDTLRPECRARADGILAGIMADLAAADQPQSGCSGAATEFAAERVSKSRKGECDPHGACQLA